MMLQKQFLKHCINLMNKLNQYFYALLYTMEGNSGIFIVYTQVTKYPIVHGKLAKINKQNFS